MWQAGWSRRSWPEREQRPEPRITRIARMNTDKDQKKVFVRVHPCHPWLLPFCLGGFSRPPDYCHRSAHALHLELVYVEPSPGPLREAAVAHILLIDDDEEFSAVLQHFLEQQEHTVRCALLAEEGLDLLAAAPPFDLVLLDNVMPRMWGLEFLIALAETDNP